MRQIKYEIYDRNNGWAFISVRGLLNVRKILELYNNVNLSFRVAEDQDKGSDNTCNLK